MSFNFIKHWPIRNLFNDKSFPIYGIIFLYNLASSVSQTLPIFINWHLLAFKAYIKVVAVKKLIVGFWSGQASPQKGEYCPAVLPLGFPVCSLLQWAGNSGRLISCKHSSGQWILRQLIHLWTNKLTTFLSVFFTD